MVKNALPKGWIAPDGARTRGMQKLQREGLNYSLYMARG